MQSAARGRELAALLDCGRGVQGVTLGRPRIELAAMGVPATVSGLNMTGDDFGVVAGWGRFGAGDAVMPGPGKAVEREYSATERTELAAALPTLGESTFDVYLNDTTFWRNVPAKVWRYRLGGYQVLKKWLSYREEAVLGRRLRIEEVQHFCDAVRRIGAMLTMAKSNHDSFP